jgi:hypothetical protein
MVIQDQVKQHSRPAVAAAQVILQIMKVEAVTLVGEIVVVAGTMTETFMEVAAAVNRVSVAKVGSAAAVEQDGLLLILEILHTVAAADEAMGMGLLMEDGKAAMEQQLEFLQVVTANLVEDPAAVAALDNIGLLATAVADEYY